MKTEPIYPLATEFWFPSNIERYSLRYATFVYRLIDAAPVGII